MIRSISRKFKNRSRRKRSIYTAREIYWGQVFDFAVRNSEWFTHTALNPGRWAFGFPGFYILFRALDEIRPHSILEFGLGESSKMTSQFRSHFPDTRLTIVEQSEEWRDIFCRTRRGLEEMIRIVPIETTIDRGRPRHDYTGLLPAVEGTRYDLVIIDGPWGSRRDSRREILDLTEAGLLSDDFVIIFDDTERAGEQDTVAKLCGLLDKKHIAYAVGHYEGLKRTSVICCEKYKFLLSL